MRKIRHGDGTVRVEDFDNLNWIDMNVEWMSNRRPICFIHDLPFLDSIELHELANSPVELHSVDSVLGDRRRGREPDDLSAGYIRVLDAGQDASELGPLGAKLCPPGSRL